MRKSNYTSYAEAKYIHISPYKLSKIANEIRGKDVKYSLEYLKLMSQRGSDVIYKLLYSCMSNASNSKNISKDDLFVAEIIVTQAPLIKRFKARARGRGNRILKRNSHIKMGLNQKTGEINGTKS